MGEEIQGESLKSTPLYHGTSAVFDSFDNEHSGEGIGNDVGDNWFTSSPSDAVGAAKTSAHGGYFRKGTTGDPHVYEVRLSNTNLLPVNKPLSKSQLSQVGTINGVDYSNADTDGYGLFYEIAKTFGDFGNVNTDEEFLIFHDSQNKAAEALSQKGITGMQYEWDGKTHCQIFNPTDIKITKRTKIKNEPAANTPKPTNQPEPTSPIADDNADGVGDGLLSSFDSLVVFFGSDNSA
ncbi:MAG: hypothetical protein EXR21_05970 [Flavobacteriaceae bacterium]|nr:hypothetical protein [Flavobacteriaceae bacterium]